MNKKAILNFIKNNYLILFLFVVALVSRTILMKNTVAICIDQVNHLLFAKEIFNNHGYLWHGARALRKICNGQQVDAYLGPFYIYLLSIPAKIGNWNFYLPAMEAGIFGASATVLIYYLGTLIANKRVGYLSAIIYCFSTAMIVGTRTLWNPFFLPFFILAWMISFIKIIKGEEKYLILFFLLFSLNTQLHASAVLLIPAFIILALIYRIKIKNKLLWLYSILIFALSYLPMIYHEVGHNFENSRIFYLMLFKSSECGVSNSSYFDTLLSTVRKYFTSLTEVFSGRVYESPWGIWVNLNYEKIFYDIIVIFFLVTFFTIWYQFIREKIEKKKSPYLLLLLAIIIPVFILGANFFAYTVWSYYFIAIIPLSIILFSYGLAQLFKYKWGKIIIFIIIGAFVVLNVNSYIKYQISRSNRAERTDLINPDMIVKDQIDLIDFIKQDSQGKAVRIDEAHVPAWDDSLRVYQYLIDLRGLIITNEGKIIYLIDDPKTLDASEKLKNSQILLEKTFGSIKLYKIEKY